MNTRLQVEHPVTELISGIDLVEQMIRVAAGEKLSFAQEDIKLKGWAIESRICAEDPRRGFLPSSGRILEYRQPIQGPNIRVDTGVDVGDEVSMFYDTMIAKLCTYGNTRDEAVANMSSALSSFVIHGVSHNISFLEALINHPKFKSGDIHTGFIEQEYPDGFSGAKLTSDIAEVFLAAGVFAYMTEQKRAVNIPGQINSQQDKLGTRWIVNIGDNQYPVIIKTIDNG
jgi:propionyl-CoA carboxylase alpha chain